MKNENIAVFQRFENIAKKVYRGNKNAIYMLINDLEEFFEMNNQSSKADMMTSEEFDEYINRIMNI